LAGVRILIADDHEAVRRGVRSLIASHSDWEICGEAVDGLDAVEKARSSRPDVVILDISMPKLSGLQAVPLIKHESPDSEILILSQHDPVQARRLAFEAGARNFISKANMARDLLAAIDDFVGRDGGPKSLPLNSESAVPDFATALPAGFEFLAGAGEMGQLIRQHDWSETPLGPIQQWPQILKTSVSLILNSQHPMWVGWGPAQTFLYNDAYISVLSLAKHPWALGRPAAEVWAEIWDYCGPLADKVFTKGEATFVDDVQLFMNRGDFVEETYYSFSYSPIRDELGNVRALFCPSKEVTPKVINARRLRTLAELTAKSLIEKSVEGACASAFSTLAKNADDIPFAMLYLIDREGKHTFLEQCAGIASGVDSLSPERIAFSSEASGAFSQAIIEVASTSQSRTVSVKELEGLPLGPAKQRVSEALVLPVTSHGQKPVGVLVAGVNPTRTLDAEYRTFYKLVSSQIATGIANARSYEEERQRAESLAVLDRAKTAFFSNVSHEFRTPLTLMLGPLEDLLVAADVRMTAEDRERFAVVHRNSLRLLKLVNSLLDFSRIEAGRVEAVFQPTDIAGLTSELASAFRPAMDRAGLQFDVECDPVSEPIYLDRDMWEKIVLNLLSNAFKFTFEGKTSVALRSVDDSVQLQISDTGIGVPEEELPRLFERFHRVEGARGRTQEGTGIGLALVQELVKIHHGNISVTSTEGSGSSFTVTIPKGKGHLPQDRVWAARTQASSAIRADSYVEEAVRWLPEESLENVVSHSDRAGSLSFDSMLPEAWERISAGELIVIADDNADMRNYLRRLLRERYRVHAVANGEEAVRAARDMDADLILTDVMMPGLDGFGVLHALRSHPKTQSKPVILLSARAGEESRVEGLQAGADDYLVKPFASRELLARVSSHLKMARVRAEAAEVERSLRAEAELERGRLRESFTMAPAAMALLSGPEHRFTFVNSAYLKMAGRESIDQLLGKALGEALPELKGQGIDDLLDQVYQTGEPYLANEREIRLKRHGKEETTYLNFSYHPMRNVAGEVEGILVHAVEVTEQVAARTQLEARVKERTADLEEAEQRLRALNNRLLRAQDEERRRLARELHDSAGQLLVALSMNLVPLEQSLAKQNPELNKLAASSVGLVDQLSKELRTMSHLLHPPLLDEAGLKSALRWYVEGFADRSGIQVDLQLDSKLPRLPQEVETTIFRIVQESLTNIHRHSGSKKASLRIDHDVESTRVEVRDEGKGISQFNSVKNMPIRAGVGIQGMQERVRQLQGKFEIKSGQTGTTVIVTLPNRVISGSAKSGKPASQGTRNK
jgi:signal transduction histidine kinase/DNA-binding response OmpR family regulator